MAWWWMRSPDNSPRYNNSEAVASAVFSGSSTRSAGQRLSKADSLRDTKEEAAAPKKPGVITYSAEGIRLAIGRHCAAFRLIATTKKESATEVTNYFNTGTFVKRDKNGSRRLAGDKNCRGRGGGRNSSGLLNIDLSPLRPA